MCFCRRVMLILPCLCGLLVLLSWLQNQVMFSNYRRAAHERAMIDNLERRTGVIVVGNNNHSIEGIGFPPEDKWIDDFANTTMLGCGTIKCAFRSRARTTAHGYLVAMECGHDNDVTLGEHELNHRVFVLAQNLTRDFALRHSFLAPPRRFVWEPRWRWLFKTLAEKTLAWKYQRLKRKAWSLSINSSVLVQPIEVYSDDSVPFKCNSMYYEQARSKVANLKAASFGVVTGDTMDTRATEDGYASRLRRDLDHTVALMESPFERCLSKDFQLVLDPRRGALIHIDLDRCFVTNPMEETWTPSCRNELASLVEATIERRGQCGPSAVHRGQQRAGRGGARDRRPRRSRARGKGGEARAEPALARPAHEPAHQ